MGFAMMIGLRTCDWPPTGNKHKIVGDCGITLPEKPELFGTGARGSGWQKYVFEGAVFTLAQLRASRPLADSGMLLSGSALVNSGAKRKFSALKASSR